MLLVFKPHVTSFSVTFSTFTIISVGQVKALGPVQTGRAGALVDVDLAHVAAEAYDAE